MEKNYSVEVQILYFNQLCTGGLFHCYVLDESICHFRVSGLFCHFILFLVENPVSK